MTISLQCIQIRYSDLDDGVGVRNDKISGVHVFNKYYIWIINLSLQARNRPLEKGGGVFYNMLQLVSEKRVGTNVPYSKTERNRSYSWIFYYTLLICGQKLEVEFVRSSPGYGPVLTDICYPRISDLHK